MDTLFFIVSKVFWNLLQPLNVLLWLLAAGGLLLWTQFSRGGRLLVTSVLLVVLLLGIFPVNAWLTTVLENRFPVVRDLPANVTGIVVLSGHLDADISRRRGQPALGSDAERLTETMALMRRFPRARVFFSGYSGRLIPGDAGAHTVAQAFFESQRADGGRIRYETRARNTYENAVYTKRLARPVPGEVWLLVTSAAHIPRSVGVFRRAGWDVVAVPVDFRTDGSYQFSPQWFSFSRVWEFNEAVKRWIGLFAYYLADKTDALLPAP